MNNKWVHQHGKGVVINALGLLLNLVTQVFFARWLGVEHYGLLAMCLALVFLSLNFADFGLTAAIPRFLAYNIGRKNGMQIYPLARTTGLFLAGISILLALFWGIGATKLVTAALSDLIFHLSLFVPLFMVLRWAMAVLKGLGRNIVQILLEGLVLPALICVFGGGVWWFLGDVQDLVIAYGLANAVVAFIGVVLVFYFLKDYPKGHGGHKVSLKPLIAQGLPAGLSGLGQTLFRRGDIIIIGIMLGESAVGFYRVAYTLVNGVRKGIAPLNNFTGYYLSHSFGAQAFGAIKQRYYQVIVLGFVLTLPLYIVLFVFADNILMFLFGVEYIQSDHILKILIPGFVVFSATGPLGALFNALGKNWSRMWIVLALSVFNIVLNIILISEMGITGAAWATSLSFFLLFVIYSFYVRASIQMMQKDGELCALSQNV